MDTQSAESINRGLLVPCGKVRDVPDGHAWEVNEPSASELWRMIMANREDYGKRIEAMNVRMDQRLVDREWYLARHEALKSSVELITNKFDEDLDELRQINANRVSFNRSIIIAITVVFCSNLVTLAVLLSHLH